MRAQLLTPAVALTLSENNSDILPILADLATWFDRATRDERSSSAKLLHGIADGWPLSTWAAIDEAMRDAAPF